MRTRWRTEVGMLAIVAAMFVAALVTLPAAPERIPIRWDLRGNVTGYGDPVLGLLLVPGLALALYLLLRFLPLIDPGRANYASFAAAYTLVRWVILLFLAGVYALIHLALRGVAIDMGLIVMLATGLLLMLFGNVMGKLRPNWFIGIRTPWTLSSKRSWTRTHAVGGRVFVIIGAAFIVAGISRAPFAVPVAVAIAMLGTVYLLAYSYVVWRTDPERIPPAGTLPAE